MEPSLSGKMYVKSPDTSKEIRIGYPSFFRQPLLERSEGLADTEWRGGVSRASAQPCQRRGMERERPKGRRCANGLLPFMQESFAPWAFRFGGFPERGVVFYVLLVF